jgi:hypothetical protein
MDDGDEIIVLRVLTADLSGIYIKSMLASLILNHMQKIEFMCSRRYVKKNNSPKRELRL